MALHVKTIDCVWVHTCASFWCSNSLIPSSNVHANSVLLKTLVMSTDFKNKIDILRNLRKSASPAVCTHQALCFDSFNVRLLIFCIFWTTFWKKTQHTNREKDMDRVKGRRGEEQPKADVDVRKSVHVPEKC